MSVAIVILLAVNAVLVLYGIGTVHLLSEDVRRVSRSTANVITACEAIVRAVEKLTR